MTRSEWTKLGIAAALVLIFNSLFAHWYVATVMRDNIAVRTEAQFHDDRQGLKTLILGDSHSKWDVDARLLEAAFNEALPGQSYMQAYYLLRGHLERGWIDPKFLIIGVDLHSFTERPGSRWGFLHFYARHVDYLEEGWRRGELLYFAMRQLQGRYAPYVAQRANIVHYLESGRPIESEHLVPVPIERGSLIRSKGLDTVPKQQWQTAAKVAAEIHLGGREPFDSRPVEDFGRLLDLCSESGIRVLLVKFPLTAEYLVEAGRYVDVDEHDQRVQELIEGRPGVTLLDARSRFSDRIGLFTDSDHLNSRGAKLLASEINRSLAELAQEADSGFGD
jgi:hypothetical protein